ADRGPGDLFLQRLAPGRHLGRLVDALVCGARRGPGHAGYLCARLTFEEAAETFSRFLPLKMTAKQAQNLMEPVGKALAEQEETMLKALFKEANHKHTSMEEQK